MRSLCLSVILSLSAVSGWCYTANDGAKTISSDGSLSDTTGAISYVAGKSQAGWVLTVGSAGGSYTWAGQVAIDLAYSFTMQGASAANRPTITSTINSDAGIKLTCTESNTITVKDFIFAEFAAPVCFIQINGSGVDCYRLSNLKFNHSTGGAIAWISDNNDRNGEGPYGCIDHCEVVSTGANSGYGFYVKQNNHSGAWGAPMTWGTKKAVYIEDCNFVADTLVTGSPCLDANQGARIVFRHNTLTNVCTGTHGSEPQTGDPVSETNGVQSVEMMNNIFDYGSQNLSWTLLMRGGTCVYFSNSIYGTGVGSSGVLQLDYYRAIPANGTCLYDRTNVATQYVGTHQPGCGSVVSAGQDPMFPTCKWGSVPVYYWSNTVAIPIVNLPVNVRPADWIVMGRDFFTNQPMPGYTPYTYPHPLAGGSEPTGGGGSTATTVNTVRLNIIGP